MSRTTIDDVLECIICLDQVADARLCPFCARVACCKCWESTRCASELCPYCRSNLTEVKLVKCGWFVDLRREVEECLLEKKRTVELEHELASVRSQLEAECQEEQVFSTEREVFIQEQIMLQKEKEENTQQSELLAVEKAILNDKRNQLDKDIAEFLNFQEAQEQDDESARVFTEIDFHLNQIIRKTAVMNDFAHDKGDALVDAFMKMKATLDDLGGKLLECRYGLREDGSSDND